MPANTRNSAKSTGRTTNTPEQLTQPVTPSEVNTPILDLFNGGADITIRSREDLKKHLSVPASADDVLIALFCMFRQPKEREDVLVERVASLTEKVIHKVHMRRVLYPAIERLDGNMQNKLIFP